jgi:hypothetical protein
MGLSPLFNLLVMNSEAQVLMSASLNLSLCGRTCLHHRIYASELISKRPALKELTQVGDMIAARRSAVGRFVYSNRASPLAAGPSGSGPKVGWTGPHYPSCLRADHHLQQGR